MVHPPQAKEEEEFDSFLDGLGGGVAATGEPVASDAAGGTAAPAETSSMAESGMRSDFGAQADAAPETMGTAPEEDFFAAPGSGRDEGGAFEFGDDQLDAGTAAEPPAAGDFDFSDLTPPGEGEPQESGMFDGQASEFDFSSESGVESASGTQSNGWEPGVADEFPDFGIGETADQLPEGAAEAEPFSEPFDFESFGETESSPAGEEEHAAGAGTGTEFDFGGVATGFPDEEPAGLDISPESTFPSFNLEPSSGATEDSGAVDDFTLDEGTESGGEAEGGFGGFDQAGESSESPLFTDEAEKPSDFSFDFGDSVAREEDETSYSGDADVQWDISPPPVAEKAGKSDVGSAALRGLSESFETSLSSPESPEMQEELPPLSIATRRKQSALVPLVATLVAIVVIGGIAGAGYYLFGGGPEAFNRVGLGFVSKWLGMVAKDEGNISVQNVSGLFTINKEAGEVFVVSGEALNNYRKPRASLQVKAVLYGKDGKVLAQKSAFCGNAISGEQVKVMQWAKIEAAMANQFGDSLANLGVQPGKGIPFVVVFSQVPKDVTDFAVEAAGSTVAGQ
jgi:hypothetical protein